MILSLKGFIYEAPNGFFTFSVKNFVLLSSATGPGYGWGIDVNTASKLEINEVYLLERPFFLAVRHTAPGSRHSWAFFPYYPLCEAVGDILASLLSPHRRF